MRSWLLVLFLVGCSASSSDEPNAAPDSSATIADTGISPTTDTAVFDTYSGPIDSTVVDTALPDTAKEADVEASAPPGPIDCLAEVGPSSGATLVDFFYQRQVGTCESSMCSDFFKFDPSCVLTLQVADVEYTATLTSEHCTRFTRWLTSKVLVDHLRDTVTCYGAMVAGAYESTQITLSDGAANKKTFMCKEEPFVSHRECLDKLRAMYFPGK
jgi:hypothetical protein